MKGRREMLGRLATVRRATLATIDDHGRPHLVPIVFAETENRIFTAVDQKPKRTRRLKRLENIRANPAASLLADRYDEDWGKLWWVRVDGTARIVEAGSEFDGAIAGLAAKYSQYREHAPAGPAIVIDIETVSGWSARD